ncbi:hypothetical protein FVB9532_02642 [Mesonia oceanica]|uniref:Uncharacterized protein n=1 Tax=Mesonia oceanica TaxID=2687242 RepID=A0AC61YA24_9FLAO|nr:hypothetical protein FVB9532_02642 [Mesonia oceanica]
MFGFLFLYLIRKMANEVLSLSFQKIDKWKTDYTQNSILQKEKF